MMDLARRQALAAAKAAVRELERPEREARKIADAKKRKERSKAIGKPAKGQRQPRVCEPLYLAWVRRLPCVAGETEGGCSGPIEAAHLRFSDAALGRVNSGMQAKPDDRWSLPLCRHHHQHDQHKRAERAFWERLGVEPGRLCLALHAAFLAVQPGTPIIKELRRKA